MYFIFFLVLSLLNYANAEVFLQPFQNNFSSNSQISYEVLLSPNSLEDTNELQIIINQDITITAEKTNFLFQNDFNVWHGKIQNDPFGHLIITSSYDGKLGIDLNAGGNSYQLITKNNLYYLLKTDQNQHKGNDYIVLKQNNSNLLATQVTTKSNDNFIDVLVFYTDDVAASDSNAEATINSKFSAANQILEDSCINFRYRIVHAEQITYTETADMQTDLDRLRTNGDGYLDTIHTLRETYGADLVTMFTMTGTGYCGLANTNTHGVFYDDIFTSIMKFTCGSFVVAHELGHNLGLNHDRYEQNLAPRQYTVTHRNGYGFVDMANKLVSVMGYGSQCSAAGVTCSAANQFSSPNISHNGIPFGVRGYSDAVTAINENFGHIANFRDSITSYSPSIKNNCVSNSEEKKDIHCFIATAAYGSYMHKDVIFLRNFRDTVLKSFSVGKHLINFYYRYSPFFAAKIQLNPLMKNLSQHLIKTVVSVIKNWKYYAATLLLGSIAILVLPLNFLFYFFIAYFALYISFANADIAVPSSFPNLISENPASRLLTPIPMLVALNYNQANKTGKEGGLSSKTDSSLTDLTLGTYNRNFFIESTIYSVDKITKTDKSSGLAKSESDYSINKQTLQAGKTFGYLGDIAFKYQKISNKESDNYESTEQQILGLGTIGLISSARYGIALDLIEEKGKSIATAKWLDLYLGIAFGNYTPGSGFIFEYNLKRSPEVKAADGMLANIHGEKLRHEIVYETAEIKTSFIPVNNLRFEYSTETEKKVTSFSNKDLTTTLYGLTIGGNLVSAANYTFGYHLKNYSDKLKSKEAIISIGLTWAFNSMGGGGGNG